MKRISIAVLCSLLPGIAASAQKAPEAESPLHLIIWYRADTTNGPLHGGGLREYLTTEGTKRFEQWKAQGLFRNYQILCSSTFSEGSWDAMLHLTFNRFTDLERWMEIERSYPGGLDSIGLTRGKPISTYLCDLPFHGGDTGEAKESAAESVFLVKPYGYDQKSIYLTYAKAYVVPEFDAWTRMGTLRSYQIYTNREPTGPPWEVLIVLEYTNMKALQNRDEVKKKSGEELKKQPGWDLLNSIKLSIRGSDEERLIARQVAP